jgi:hypothetical protein
MTVREQKSGRQKRVRGNAKGLGDSSSPQFEELSNSSNRSGAKGRAK